MEKIEKIALIFIVLFSLMLLFVSFDLKPELGDEGILAMDGWRIYKGQVPQKDFFQFIPPLAAYIQSAFFEIFSPSAFAIRILGFIYGLLLLILSYMLFLKFVENRSILSLSLSFAIIWGVSGWYFGSHHWLCNILQLFGFYIFKRGIDEEKTYFSFISGLFFGLAIFSLQDQGGYVVIGLLGIGVFLKNKLNRHFVFASATAIATFGILSLPFLFSRGAVGLFKDWVIFPILNYRQNTGNKTGFSFVLEQFLGLWDLNLIKSFMLFKISYAIFNTFILLMPILCIFSLYLIFKRNYLKKIDYIIVLIISLGFIFTSLRRPSISNFIWASPAFLPFYIVADKFLSESKKILKVVIHTIVWTLVSCALFYCFVKISFCVNKNYVFSAQTSSGSYRFFDKYQRDQFQQIVDQIESRVPEEEKLFCIGYIPLLNFVTQRENPTRFNFVFASGYTTNEQILNWLDTIERNKTKYGIGEKTETGEYFRNIVLKKYKTIFENDKYFLLQRVEK
ncbi:MAG: glycosyltransferase family 39 protein [Acidobacteria bacterium]|nr:glycosyltransferase family 39 protein [Acidobacteriota bacterium]